MSPADLFERASQIAPGFGPVFAEHLEDNDELLPHVLMYGLLQFVGERLPQSNESVESSILNLLELLEAEVRGDNPETESVIAISFLEYLQTEPFFKWLYPLLGPNLRATYAALSEPTSAQMMANPSFKRTPNGTA